MEDKGVLVLEFRDFQESVGVQAMPPSTYTYNEEVQTEQVGALSTMDFGVMVTEGVIRYHNPGAFEESEEEVTPVVEMKDEQQDFNSETFEKMMMKTLDEMQNKHFESLLMGSQKELVESIKAFVKERNGKVSMEDLMAYVENKSKQIEVKMQKQFTKEVKKSQRSSQAITPVLQNSSAKPLP